MLFALLFLETGCSVLAVADAAVSVGATVVKAGASAASTVVDAVLPSKDKK
jgi:tRNA G37 N-methylase TrmD